MVRQLYAYGWRKKRINDFLDGYMSLLDEVVDHRRSINSAIKDAEEVSGIDIRKLVDELMNNESEEQNEHRYIINKLFYFFRNKMEVRDR